MPRALELLIALAALAVLSPLIAAVAVVNWALTRRVLFRQTRLGRGLAPFVMLKFQTMVDSSGGGTVTVADDPRLTVIGKALRTVKLDELPQLVNVIRGEMALVGPRALPASEWARIPGELAARVTRVRPGMTGLATLALADEERRLAALSDPEEIYFRELLPRKMALEAVYAARRTIGLDLLLLALTPLAVVAPGLCRSLLRRVLPETAALAAAAEEGLPGARSGHATVAPGGR